MTGHGAPAGKGLTFFGDGGTLFGIFIQNFLLSIVTLGIYSFWGRTRVRQYLWSQTELDGDRFAYHGTGNELLKGWAKAMLVLFAFYALVYGAFFGLQRVLGPAGAQAVGVLFFYVGLALLIPVALVGARRYRMSRTSWRGIRFSFHGRVGELLGLYVKGALMMLVTFTLYSPFFRNDLRAFNTRYTRFGSLPFAFDGRGFDLFRPFVLNVLLTIPTLGLCWFWYAARRDRYYWEHTSIGGARFASTMTGGGLLGTVAVVLLLSVFTLGLGAPWAMVRLMDYRTETLSLAGTVDLAGIQQQAQSASGTGEGLAGAFDIDGGFDAGIGL